MANERQVQKNPPCAECGAPGEVGLGAQPVWLCLDHFGERLGSIRRTVDKLRGLGRESADGEHG